MIKKQRQEIETPHYPEYHHDGTRVSRTPCGGSVDLRGKNQPLPDDEQLKSKSKSSDAALAI